MRVLLVGGSGAIGAPLTARLITGGHEVVGTARSPQGLARIEALGATAVALDLLDPDAVGRAVVATSPDAVVHQATALAGARFARSLDRAFATTNRLRTDGTDALVAAVADAGVPVLVAQSFAANRYARTGPVAAGEDDPLDPAQPASMRRTSEAMSHLERTVAAAGGMVLRYGGFYGAAVDAMVEPVRKRQFPIIGSGGGCTSFVHVDDAAAATVLALENGRPGRTYNVVDDEPAPVRDWLPVLADALGAGRPRRIPRWLARLVAGEAAVVIATEARGASNQRARSELRWAPYHRSWRTGFVDTYATSAPRPAAPRAAR